MAAKKSDDRYVNLLPGIQKAPLFNVLKEIIFSSDISQSKLLEHNIPDDGKENKYFHKWMIALSLVIQILLKRIAKCLNNFGNTIEELLNGNIFLRKEERMDEKSNGFISFLGKLDTRMELNKDIKHGDARYYPALSMMASKLAYENQAVIKTTVSHHWKMDFVKFYDCYNEFQKKPTTQVFIMREETAEDDKIMVAFRGTSPFDADDWSTDFDFSWCKIDGIGKTHMGFMVALGFSGFHDAKDIIDYHAHIPKEINQDPNTPKAYYVIRDKLKEIMSKNKRAKFIVTGHSLGGALAVLFPAVLALHGEVELLNKLEAIYTFGQPRVGNEKFGNFMKNTLRKHNIKYYRVVYGYDCIPSVPFDNKLMTFKHFGTCIHFNSLYHGKVVEEEQKKAVQQQGKEGRLQKYLTLLSELVMIIIGCIIARVIAIWELIRGLIIGFTAGPYYKEGWLLIGFRIVFGILFPEGVNHNPQDYVNATMLTSEDLFKFYPAMNT